MTHPRRVFPAALAATALSASSPAHALPPLRAFLSAAHVHNLDRRERLAVAQQKREDAATARRGILPVASARAQCTFNASEARVTRPVGGKTETAVLNPQHQWDGYVAATVPIVVSVSRADIRAKFQTNGDLRYDRIALRLAAGHSLDVEEAP